MAKTVKLSGVMHCWLAAKAEWAGRVYVCLRGVSFRGEPAKDSGRPDDRAKTRQNVFHPLLHVPTLCFSYDVAATIPDASAVSATAKKIVAAQWPVLNCGKIISADQDLTGLWGGKNAKGQAEAVTRIALDLGKVSRLPQVKWKPSEKLPWPRHPVFWVPAEDISLFEKPVQQGAYISAYALAGDHSIDMEVNNKGETVGVVVRDMPLQQTVGDIFSKAFGAGLLTPRVHRPATRPSLLLAASFTRA